MSAPHPPPQASRGCLGRMLLGPAWGMEMDKSLISPKGPIPKVCLLTNCSPTRVTDLAPPTPASHTLVLRGDPWGPLPVLCA